MSTARLAKTVPDRTDDAFLEAAATTLRAVAHPLRLRLLALLQQHEVPVTELAALAGISQAVASQHLRLMAQAGAVKGRREGQQVFYRVINPNVLALLQCMRDHHP